MTKSFKQYDTRWANKNYNGSSTISAAGCGPTSCADLIYNINPKITPLDTVKYMQTHGDSTHKTFAIYGNGTAWNGIPACLKYFGLTDVKEVVAMPSVWDYLNEGYVAIFLFTKGSRGGVTWTTGGHYLAVDGYKVENGKHKLKMFDPGGRDHDGWYCYETHMKGLISKVWVGKCPNKVEPPKPVEKKAYTGTLPSASPLKKGNKGTRVTYLQKFLNWAVDAKLTVDGDFGNATKTALKKFQKKVKLTQDGVWGPKTRTQAKAFKK